NARDATVISAAAAAAGVSSQGLGSTFEQKKASEFDAYLSAPLAVTAAAAWRFAARSELALEAEGRPGLRHHSHGGDRRCLWNAPLGDKVDLGFGLFTDRTDAPPVDGLGAVHVDYYGTSLCLQWQTPLALVSDPRPDALVFVTTLGLRYALGIGEAGGLALDMR